MPSNRQFKAMSEQLLIREEQVWESIPLLKSSDLYDGSDGSEKDSRVSRAYWFTISKKEGGYGEDLYLPLEHHETYLRWG